MCEFGAYIIRNSRHTFIGNYRHTGDILHGIIILSSMTWMKYRISSKNYLDYRITAKKVSNIELQHYRTINIHQCIARQKKRMKSSKNKWAKIQVQAQSILKRPKKRPSALFPAQYWYTSPHTSLIIAAATKLLAITFSNKRQNLA